jgi:hypothetical protein
MSILLCSLCLIYDKNLLIEFFISCLLYIIEPIIHGRLTSPLRSSTPQFNGNGNTRPTSPASSSPLRHTIAATSASVNHSNNNIRSREVSRERERGPLDYTDLEGNRNQRILTNIFCFLFSHGKSTT